MFEEKIVFAKSYSAHVKIGSEKYKAYARRGEL
jgi:hypothetical protein